MRKRSLEFFTLLTLAAATTFAATQLSAQQSPPDQQSSPLAGQSQPQAQPPNQSGQQAPDQAQPQQSQGQIFTGVVVKQGDRYMLQDADSGKTYDIDRQDLAKPHEGKKVRVQGTLDADGKLIHVK